MALSRRRFLAASGATASAVVLASCTSSGSPLPLAPLPPLALNDDEVDQDFIEELSSYNDEDAINTSDELGGLLVRNPNARSSMRELKRICASFLSPYGALTDEKQVANLTSELMGYIESLQTQNGLFDSGNNLESPPDSAFSLVDLTIIARLLDMYDDTDSLQEVSNRLESLGSSLAVAIATSNGGGVHTANHRWEIAGALYSANALWPNDTVKERADTWVAEGIDVYQDGLFSERSTQYDSEVVNPSLLRMAKYGGLTEAIDLVRDNLKITLGMTNDDGIVETVQSRRQDQWRVREDWWYLLQYREFALLDNDGEFAFAAERIRDRKLTSTGVFLAEALIEPELAQALPDPVPTPEDQVIDLRESSSLVLINESGSRRAAVFAGTDYNDTPIVASGLSTNPTFFKFQNGAAALTSLRVSPQFFSMGPLRMELENYSETDGFTLKGTKLTGYHEPIPDSKKSADGMYELSNDGRFFSAMSFEERELYELQLTSHVSIRKDSDKYLIVFDTEAPKTIMVAQLNFSGGGELKIEGDYETLDRSSPDGIPQTVLHSGKAIYKVGNDEISIDFEGIENYGSVNFDSGEKYSYLNGYIPSIGDQQLLVAATIPGQLKLEIS